MAIRIKTAKEISVLQECGKRLAAILKALQEKARPGTATGEIDLLAQNLIRDAGGIAVFRGYRVEDSPPYPASICTSINDEVVHGIPRPDTYLREGDILAIDIGMAWPRESAKEFPSYQGRRLVTDTAVSFSIGNSTRESDRLLRGTKEALWEGIDEVKSGKRVGDISARIQKKLTEYGFGIVKGLAGHGVGYELHEDPLIPNYGKAGTGPLLKTGMVLAIEPMATLGKGDVRLDRDGWTFRTIDGSATAHFEHTVVLTLNGTLVLTMI